MMKNQRNLAWLMMVILGVVCLSSCKKNPIKYIPFQSEDGKWGLMTVDGEALFKDKFESAPTISYNGFFLVQNKEGLWEYYTVEENPRRIGEEYAEATFFSKGGLAVVAKKGQCVEVINRDGKVKFKLDKFDGQKVISVSYFNDNGLAMVTVEGDKKGVVDENGKVVLPAQYCRLNMSNFVGIGIPNDYILAVDAKYENEMNEVNTDAKWLIMNMKGDVLTELPVSKYKFVHNAFDNHFVVELQDEKGWGIIDKDGKEVVAPQQKYKNIIRLKNKRFACVDDNEMISVYDFDGNLVYKDVFDQIYLLPDDRLVVGEFGNVSIVDKNGKPQTKEKYKVFIFYGEASDRLVMGKDKHFVSVDADGKETVLKDVKNIRIDYPKFDVRSQEGFTDSSRELKNDDPNV